MNIKQQADINRHNAKVLFKKALNLPVQCDNEHIDAFVDAIIDCAMLECVSIQQSIHEAIHND